MNLSGFHLLGRTADNLRTEEEKKSALETCSAMELDGLILVGASHTLSDSTYLASYFLEQKCRTRVISIPAAIDNNLSHSKI